MDAGTVLRERYRIDTLLAEGGMARVYRAHDLLLDRPVAVKVLREQYAGDQAFLERFQQEARAAAGLAHPNIVSIHDVGSDAGVHFIVMELVDGPNLKQIIQQERQVSPARSMELVQQILAALSFAHERGIVHRDVKPQNILVTNLGHAKVADFGIARAAKASQLTETGLVMGSVHYCAPEQAMGQPTTQASDVYSLGVVLYEMLSGRLPFESDNALGVALKHVQEPPRPLREINPLLPPGLESIVLRALAKDPAQRYATAEEMLQALQTYRRLGEQGTAPFAPVSPAMAIPAGPMAAPSRVAPSAIPLGPIPLATARKRRGFDWLVLVFGVLILAMIAGWVPLAMRLYDLYFRLDPAAALAVATEVPMQQQPVPLGPTGLPSTPTPRVAPSPTAVGIAVPQLVGLTYADAERILERNGLSISMSQDYNNFFPVGVVYTQTVAAGQNLPPGTTVGVSVSKGAAGYTIPDLVNQPFDQARLTLEQRGLKVTRSETWNDRIAAGRIIAQQPISNTLVFSGTSVSLVVSLGRQTLATPVPTVAPWPTARPTATPTRVDTRGLVPNLVGLPEAEARRRIDTAKLTNTYANYQRLEDISPANREFFLSIAPGAVVSQDPRAGEVAVPGQTVRLAVRSE